MVKKSKEVRKSKDSGAGLAIPACLFIGMGIGFLLNNLVPGLFIGLGIGFLIFLILRMLGK